MNSTATNEPTTTAIRAGVEDSTFTVKAMRAAVIPKITTAASKKVPIALSFVEHWPVWRRQGVRRIGRPANKGGPAVTKDDNSERQHP
ncbi:hypothetical protein ABT144_11305 [Streptomyces sp. NPDC002039]|uniref:hypothetical protein n=1 Tax=unclassified Streptomyces TaxID=2593676 RepID=UPI00332EB36D